MSHFVYIIYSPTKDKYYRGYSTRPRTRIIEHNNGKSRYTALANDWALVYIEPFADKKEALRREKALKKYSKDQIKRLVESPKNQLDRH